MNFFLLGLPKVAFATQRTELRLINFQLYRIDKPYSIEFTANGWHKFDLKNIFLEWKRTREASGLPILYGSFDWPAEKKLNSFVFSGKKSFPSYEERYDGPKGMEEIDTLKSLASFLKERVGEIKKINLSYCDKSWTM